MITTILTPVQTGGPDIQGSDSCSIYAARQGNLQRLFNIHGLATTVGRKAGQTWQEHATLIQLANCDGRLFERIDAAG